MLAPDESKPRLEVDAPLTEVGVFEEVALALLTSAEPLIKLLALGVGVLVQYHAPLASAHD